jgi:hypothetical protein
VSIALSFDGNRVAIGDVLMGNGSGRVRVYDWAGCHWVQVGPDMVGSRRFGQGVALSSDGHRVAIGEPSSKENDYGHVRLYDWAGSQWSQVGCDLVGEVAGDWFGSDIALSSDGSRVALAASFTNTGYRPSHVQIFDWVGRQWTQAGSNLYVEGQATCITLSSDGNRVAIGSPYSMKTNPTPSAGLVRIYDWKGNQWTQAGSSLVGQADGDWFGKSVALSSDGSRIAVGAPCNIDHAGHVRIYDWTTQNRWTQVGRDLVGRTTDQYFGWNIALSSDGNRVVIGAPKLFDLAQADHVEIHDWTGSHWSKAGSGDLVRQADGGLVGKVPNRTSYVRLYDLEESRL